MNRMPAADDRPRQWCALAGICAVVALTSLVYFGESRSTRQPAARARAAHDIVLTAPPVGAALARPTTNAPRPETRAARRRGPDVDRTAVVDRRAATQPALPLTRRASAVAWQAPLPPPSRPLSRADDSRRRGPVTRALAKAGSETGRGFRRVGNAFQRVF